jgi:hypoxanthine phosphoribosyltransferase
MAKKIRQDFPDEPLHLVGVLKGAVFFLSDLARGIPGEVSFDFIAVSSYGKNTRSSGQVRLTKDLDASIEGKTVIVVEDILDTGMTLQYLLRVFEQHQAEAVARGGFAGQTGTEDCRGARGLCGFHHPQRIRGGLWAGLCGAIPQPAGRRSTHAEIAGQSG